MIIKNSTPWDTSDIRKLFYRCIKEVEKIEKPDYRFTERRKRFTLEILNTEYDCRGRAAINGHWVMIKISKAWTKEETISDENRKKLALLIIHEYYHTIGYKHQDSCHYKRDFTAKWLVDWINEYPIRKKKIILKPKIDLKQKRYEQALANLKKATTKRKRAETIYKKWLKKVKYYNKQLNK